MKIPRNEPCPCLSGKKYKKCCDLNPKAVAFQSIDEIIYHNDMQNPDEQNLPDVITKCNGIVDLIDNKELAQAITDINELHAAHPNNYYTNFVQGICALKENKLPEAIAFFDKSIKIFPTFTEAHYNLGNAYFVKEDLVGTVNCMKKVIEIETADPHNQEVKELAQNMLNGLSKFAKEKYNCTLESLIKFNMLVDRADNCFFTNNYKKAILIYQQALEFVPADINVHEKMASAYNELGDSKKAWNYIHKLILLDPTYITKLDNMMAAKNQTEKDDAEDLPVVNDLEIVAESAQL